MSYPARTITTFPDLLRTLWRHRVRWLLASAVLWALLAAYLILVPPSWEAWQGIVICDDAVAAFGLSPRHSGGDAVERKDRGSQQTLLELSLSQSLLARVLAEVGPSPDGPPPIPRFIGWAKSQFMTPPPAVWPDEDDIQNIRDAITLMPPKGAEFGKTDVFYLKVKDRDRGRALALVARIYEGLEQAYAGLRASAVQTALREAGEAERLAQRNLGEALQKMARIERDLAGDLVALRMLNANPSNDIALYRMMANSQDEIRHFRTSETEQTATLQLLEKAKTDPQMLQAGPREFINTHPALARLIQGLSDSRLKAAGLASRLMETDPELKAARREEQEIRGEIQRELAAAMEGVKAALAVDVARRQLLESQAEALQKRADRVASVRAEYSSNVELVAQRQKMLEDAHRQMAQAHAAQMATGHTNTLTRIDQPDAGDKPLGPRRSLVALVGILAGIVGGAGLVFLTLSPAPEAAAEPQANFARPATLPQAQPLSRAVIAPIATRTEGNGQKH